MTSVQVPLSDSLKSFVETQATKEGCGVGEYVNKVLVSHQETQEWRQRIDAQLLEGMRELDRGEGQPMTAEDWENLRQRVTSLIKPNENPHDSPLTECPKGP